jgi:ATP-dependent Clp protease adapter protein ClpS
VSPFLAYSSTPRRRPPPPPALPPGADPAATDALWAVRVIDNDRNTYEQVMRVTIEALGIGVEDAYAVAWTVDHEGSCVVVEAPRAQAEAVAAHIRTIGIEVVLEPLSVPPTVPPA